MRISNRWLRRQIAVSLVILMAAPFSEAAAGPAQHAPGGQQSQSESSSKDLAQDSSGPANKPGTDTSQSEAAYPDAPKPVRSQSADQSGQSGTSQSNPEQQQPSDNKPVGTAAAPYEKTTGVAASRPAGAVIAPAKQRRARSILIRVGVVVGAAVAVGTVAALSRGSSGRPN
jgi:hypothetical protein